MVVVTRSTSRNTVAVVVITNTEHAAIDVVPVSNLNCAVKLSGFVRCDQIYTIRKADRYWKRFVLRLDDEDMEQIGRGLRAALQL